NQVGSHTAGLLVAGDITQLGRLPQLCQHALGIGVQLTSARILERVLKLSAADPVLNGQILHWLHKQRYSGNARELRLQTANHIASVDLPVSEWLQVDENPAAVECHVGSVDPYKRRKALYGWIAQNDLRQSLLPLRHFGKRDGLRRFRNALDHSRVLNREKPFRDNDE